VRQKELRGVKMSKAKTASVQISATDEAQRVYLGAKTVSELPLEYVMARKEYLQTERNGLRQANALSFLTQQNGFMFWFYAKIGAREVATFEIDGKPVNISKADFLTGYKKAVGIMREVGEAKICAVSFTKNGNVAVKANAGIIAVLA
jgi:hypothetical protein